VQLAGSVVIKKTIVLGKGTTLTIQGADANATLDGAGTIRLFQVPASGSLVLQEITVQNAVGMDIGGAVEVQANGSLDVRSCVFRRNSCTAGKMHLSL
jgi:hypothetical protein